jgi:hypothetical protein
MSKGHGWVQRYVLAALDNLHWSDAEIEHRDVLGGLSVDDLAAACFGANYDDEAGATRAQAVSIKRAVRRLAEEGRVVVSYRVRFYRESGRHHEQMRVRLAEPGDTEFIGPRPDLQAARVRRRQSQGLTVWLL